METKKCERLNAQTKETLPEIYKERQNSIYSTNMDNRTPSGWTIVKRTVLQSTTLPNHLVYRTYDVISAFDKYDQNVVPIGAAMLDILNKMGFHQIHFYCHKKSVGRVVSIMTKNNTAGQQVVRYFTDDAFAKTTFPDACGSFCDRQRSRGHVNSGSELC
ncbi:hypothetical protein QZH41_010825 [Actinostola sp. cb2023]|nr:hypothetical protein QZH41_010825 [Actinostola sp. cb2023]